MEGSSCRKFYGSKGTETWGIPGIGTDTGRSGEVRLAKGLYLGGRVAPLKVLWE